jgi:hypothetical protein
MRKMFAVLLAMILCISMAIPVFATDFVPSITSKPTPTIVTVNDDKGNVAIGEVLDKDGNVIGYIYEDCLVITSVADAKTSELIPDDAETLLLSVYDKLSDNSMKLPYEKIDKNINDATMVIRDLFDVSWLCDDHPEQIAENGVSVRIKFDLGVKQDDKIHTMSYKNNEWNPIVETKNNGDGTVSCIFENFCPVAFVVDTSNAPPAQTSDSTNVALWATIMSVSVIALIALIVLTSRRKDTE